MTAPADEGGQGRRYTETTVEHFQKPRNVGRLPEANALGYLDDPLTETTISIYMLIEADVIRQATFRTLGCSACIAASSILTEMLIERSVEVAAGITGEDINRALGGLPADKVYCADLVAGALSAGLSDFRRPPLTA